MSCYTSVKKNAYVYRKQGAYKDDRNDAKTCDISYPNSPDISRQRRQEIYKRQCVMSVCICDGKHWQEMPRIGGKKRNNELIQLTRKFPASFTFFLFRLLSASREDRDFFSLNSFRSAEKTA